MRSTWLWEKYKINWRQLYFIGTYTCHLYILHVFTTGVFHHGEMSLLKQELTQKWFWVLWREFICQYVHKTVAKLHQDVAWIKMKTEIGKITYVFDSPDHSKRSSMLFWGSESCLRILNHAARRYGDQSNDLPISGWPVLPPERQTLLHIIT